jgi:ATP-dependent RNA helicase DDX23/PRP28
MGKKYEDQIKNEIHDHWKSKKFEEMTERDWRIFREDN